MKPRLRVKSNCERSHTELGSQQLPWGQPGKKAGNDDNGLPLALVRKPPTKRCASRLAGGGVVPGYPSLRSALKKGHLVTVFVDLHAVQTFAYALKLQPQQQPVIGWNVEVMDTSRPNRDECDIHIGAERMPAAAEMDSTSMDSGCVFFGPAVDGGVVARGAALALFDQKATLF